VLRKSEEQVLWAGIDIGTNYAAATWSGDIGAAAAEATLKVSKGWEDANPKATEEERIKFYYNTRAPEWDLLADIDAWGIHALRLGQLAGDLNSIDKLLAFYYQHTHQGGLRRLTTQRKKALERFLRHYGFKYHYERHIQDYPALEKQDRPSQRIRAEIGKFGKIWMLRRKPELITREDPRAKAPESSYVTVMALLFTRWLENQAIENGVTVD
jgi:hypothetical protein